MQKVKERLVHAKSIRLRSIESVKSNKSFHQIVNHQLPRIPFCFELKALFRLHVCDVRCVNSLFVPDRYDNQIYFDVSANLILLVRP
jgi:hypothetical protein